MALLDDILKSALGGQTAAAGGQTSAAGGQAGSLLQGLLEMLDDPGVGGVSGLARAFQQQGLGDAVASWIGTGANQPISGDQLASALGSTRVSELARRAGLSTSQAPGVLAAVLPALIDQLTPRGEVPPRAELAETGQSLFQGIRSGFGSPGQKLRIPEA